MIYTYPDDQPLQGVHPLQPNSPTSSQIGIRDEWQIEGELDVFPFNAKGEAKEIGARITQEFFLFLPSSLHVNSHTYSKEQFYLDRTNLLRFKTPQIRLDELVHQGDPRSPFSRIEQLVGEVAQLTDEQTREINSELKLVANIIRSQFRDQCVKLIDQAKKGTIIQDQAQKLLKELKQARFRLGHLEKIFVEKDLPKSVFEHLNHVEEFISRAVEQISIHTYLKLQENGLDLQSFKDQALEEKQLRITLYHEPHDFSTQPEEQKEALLYREGLLSKFALSALLLATKRSAFMEKYGQVTASLAAGVAMSIYLLFFFWRGSFLIDSFSLIILSTLLYILKDRVKEGLKNLLQQQASQWFDDFETDILGPYGQKLGVIGEHFHQLDPARLPEEIINLRNKRIPSSLAKVLRPETVLYYKKRIHLQSPKKSTNERLFDYHHVYRLNLSEFLKRASNVLEDRTLIHPETGSITTVKLPKVYHLNLIVKTTWEGDQEDTVSLERDRIVVNKNGILRIESVS